MELKFISYRGNWADGMDVSCYRIVSKQWLENIKELVNKYNSRKGEVEFMIGSNQEMRINSLKDWFDGITIRDISLSEAKTLVGCFGVSIYEYGIGTYELLDAYELLDTGSLFWFEDGDFKDTLLAKIHELEIGIDDYLRENLR